MAVLQSTYTSRHPALTLGQVVNQELSNTTSRILQGATAVGFGRALFTGTTDKGVTATPSALFEGITVKDVTMESAVADTFEQFDTVPLCRLGVIAVQASKAVDKGDAVYVTGAGAFTDVSTANTLIPRATFDATTTAAGLCPVRLA
jgi:hypothetical protein